MYLPELERFLYKIGADVLRDRQYNGRKDKHVIVYNSSDKPVVGFDKIFSAVISDKDKVNARIKDILRDTGLEITLECHAPDELTCSFSGLN